MAVAWAVAWAAAGALLHAAWSTGGGKQTPPSKPEIRECPPSVQPAMSPPVVCPQQSGQSERSCPAAPPCPDAAQPAEVSASQGEAPSEPPKLPLPRMPGHRAMLVDARWDPEQASWLLVRTTEVPVKLEHARRFYEKAIKGVDMTLIPGAPYEEEGATKLIMRGRRPHEHVQVSLRQLPDQQLTRVRVMWRNWPASEAKREP